MMRGAREYISPRHLSGMWHSKFFKKGQHSTNFSEKVNKLTLSPYCELESSFQALDDDIECAFVENRAPKHYISSVNYTSADCILSRIPTELQ